MNIGSLKERTRVPYKEHTGKFKVCIGNGTNKNEYDWVYIEQDINKTGIVLIKHKNYCICFDSKRFKKKDFSHPLNMKCLRTSEEAYENS